MILPGSYNQWGGGNQGEHSALANVYRGSGADSWMNGASQDKEAARILGLNLNKSDLLSKYSREDLVKMGGEIGTKREAIKGERARANARARAAGYANAADMTYRTSREYRDQQARADYNRIRDARRQGFKSIGDMNDYYRGIGKYASGGGGSALAAMYNSQGGGYGGSSGGGSNQVEYVQPSASQAKTAGKWYKPSGGSSNPYGMGY